MGEPKKQKNRLLYHRPGQRRRGEVAKVGKDVWYLKNLYLVSGWMAVLEDIGNRL